MRILISLLFVASLACYAKEAFVELPQSFMQVERKHKKPSVLKNYLYKEKTGFSPSFNICRETISVKEAEYIKAVKNNLLSHAEYTITELPKLKTKAGKAYFFQIDKKDKWGDVRLLQLILCKKNEVYVITSCALKKDYDKFEDTFIKAFKSFSLK